MVLFSLCDIKAGIAQSQTPHPSQHAGQVAAATLSEATATLQGGV